MSGFKCIKGGLRIALGKGEGDIRPRRIRDRHILHDHVNVRPDLGADGEDSGRDAGAVREVRDGDLVLRTVVRDTGDDGLLHVLLLGVEEGCRRDEALELGVCRMVRDPGAVLL